MDVDHARRKRRGAVCPNQHRHLDLDQRLGGLPMRPPVLSAALLESMVGRFRAHDILGMSPTG